MSLAVTCKTRKYIRIGLQRTRNLDRLASTQPGPFVWKNHPYLLDLLEILCRQLFATLLLGEVANLYYIGTCSRHGTPASGIIVVAVTVFRGFIFIQPPGTLIVANRKKIHIGFRDPNADSAKL